MFRGRYKLYLPYLKGSRSLLFLSLLAAIVFAGANAFGLPFLMGKVLPAVFGDEATRAAPLLKSKVYARLHQLGYVGLDTYVQQGLAEYKEYIKK